MEMIIVLIGRNKLPESAFLFKSEQSQQQQQQQSKEENAKQNKPRNNKLLDFDRNQV